MSLRVKKTFLMKSRYRLLLPLLIVSFAKLSCSYFIYPLLNMGSSNTYWMTVNWDSDGQNTNLKTVLQQGRRWPHLFLGRDSGCYLPIVMKGYAFSSKSSAFFPDLPASSWIINLFLQDPAYSIIASQEESTLPLDRTYFQILS